MTPCGKIVDYLRTCYSTKFRFFPADLTRESDVTWYRPDPGAQQLNLYNRFSSSVYSPPLVPATSPQIGEIVGHVRTYYNGLQIGTFPGTFTCTDAAKWSGGSPGPGADFDEAACCTPPPPMMTWELWSGGDGGAGLTGLGAPGAGGLGGNYISMSVPQVSGQQWTITIGTGGGIPGGAGGGTVVQPTIAGPPIIFCGRTGSFPVGQLLGGAGSAPVGFSGGGGGSSASAAGAGVAAVGQPGAVGLAGQGNGGNGGIRVPATAATVGSQPGGGGGGKQGVIGAQAKVGGAGKVILADSAGVHTFLASGTYTVP